MSFILKFGDIHSLSVFVDLICSLNNNFFAAKKFFLFCSHLYQASVCVWSVFAPLILSYYLSAQSFPSPL